MLLRQPNRNMQLSVTFALCVSSQGEVKEEELNEGLRELFNEQTGGQTSQVDISETLTRGDSQRVTSDHNGSTAHTHTQTIDNGRTLHKHLA